MNIETKQIFPPYVRYFYILASIVLTVFVVMLLKFIISPMLAAAIVAILLTPMAVKIEKIGMPRILSTILITFLFFLSIFLLIGFITTQLKVIASDPALSNISISQIINHFEKSASNWLGFSLQEKFQFSFPTIDAFLKNAAPYFSGTIMGTVEYLTMFFMFFMSLFFFLYYRTFFLSFIYKFFDESTHDYLRKTLNKINESIKSYIVGFFTVIFSIAVLISLGLLFVGINHAIFFGMLAAVLTIIPYVGILVGALLPLLYALGAYDTLWHPLGVICVFAIVQFLEGNFITPLIIGSKQNINPYVAILGLFIGGNLLGAMGVILAIPLLGIAKIIFDDFPSLKPIGYVMGNPKHNATGFSKFLDKILKRK